jgi:hypothetical protein
MTIPTPPDPTAAEAAKHLPHSIVTYLREADPAHRANAHDLLSAFTPDAVVVDEETTYTGHDEIHRWRETAATEYTYTVEPPGGRLPRRRRRPDLPLHPRPRNQPHHPPRDRPLRPGHGWR